MKVDREVGHDWQKTSIDFGLKRSKIKVTGLRNSKPFLDDNWRTNRLWIMKDDREIGQ